MFFDGFPLDEAGPFRLRMAGAGPPLLLLHGQPQTHAMWHAVAPRLADRFTVICPDLLSHRTEVSLATDMLAMMTGLGHAQFAVAGHDLGGHVACRLALDAPDRVSRIAVLEIVPIPQHLDRADMAFSLSDYPSCWFGQLHPKPEALVTHAPSDWFRTEAPQTEAPFFHPEAVADYLRAAVGRNRAPEHAAEAGPHAGRPLLDPGKPHLLSCPMLVLWGSRGRIGGWYDPVQLWADCADATVTGHPIEAGYFLVEENPNAVASAFLAFFACEASGPAS